MSKAQKRPQYSVRGPREVVVKDELAGKLREWAATEMGYPHELPTVKELSQ